MTAPTKTDILDALRVVYMPDSGQDIVTLEMISGLIIKEVPKGVHISFVIEVSPKQALQLESLRRAAEQAVQKLRGVLSVTAILTAHKEPPKSQPLPSRQQQLELSSIRFVVAVASGKGGVGKSTTAVNLAVALAANGQKVGLLDADIYGPSVPRLLGLAGKPQINDDKKLMPMMSNGVATMSIGFLIAEETPVVWRGPMVQGALIQMLRDVAWGELDVLVVDMPPGTGDIQLTMAQQVPLAGTVIVSTPQDIALLDARKGIAMFRKVDVPILGIIENMSYFLCPHCGERSDVFSHGGARAEATKLEVPFLGEMPLDIAVRETSDAGKPITASQPKSPQAKTYRAIATRIWEQLNGTAIQRTAPKIIMN